MYLLAKKAVILHGNNKDLCVSFCIGIFGQRGFKSIVTMSAVEMGS
jgi:hypothetical protein